MQLIETTLTDVKLLQPRRYADSRGWFAEVFSQKTFAQLNLPPEFVQDNQSFSTQGVLRGLHYQLEKPQGKLVRVLSGHIWDVAVDLRRGSPTFGRWVATELSLENMRQLLIPVGFGHAFLTLSDLADVQYRCSGYYTPAAEGRLVWNDPDVGIDWPIKDPTVSPRDAQAPRLRDYLANPAFRFEPVEPTRR